MKITKQQLKQIIKEELETVLVEQLPDTGVGLPVTTDKSNMLMFDSILKRLNKIESHLESFV
jgi:hypothetical protein|tara:strand:+ start:1791 stop:1976 length:186 start_codon:yes stop_codon:yes gene_type:complete